MNWKVKTEDNDISLHDHVISDVHFGNDITLLFEDGFDVKKENVCNKMGRHKITGSAAMILHNAGYMRGVKYLPENLEKTVEIEELVKIDFEVLDFSFDHETGKAEFVGNAWDESVFCKLEFKADKVSYCWNEFVDDAWFQEVDGKEA